MLKRASTLLGQNDIAGARLIFQYLAHHGSPRGAFALAESYDPKKWDGHRVTGMTPDARLGPHLVCACSRIGKQGSCCRPSQRQALNPFQSPQAEFIEEYDEIFAA